MKHLIWCKFKGKFLVNSIKAIIGIRKWSKFMRSNCYLTLIVIGPFHFAVSITGNVPKKSFFGTPCA